MTATIESQRIDDKPRNNTMVTETFADKARAAFAEFIGVALFVWAGCGTVVSSQSILTLNPESGQQNAFLASVALAFGIAITVLIYGVAPISGGHLNPAVTMAFVMLGKMDIVTGLRYVLSQCLGSIFGAGLVWGSTASSVIEEFSGEGEKGKLSAHRLSTSVMRILVLTNILLFTAPPFFLGSNFVADTLPASSAFLGETLGTFLLVWTVIRTAMCKDSNAGNFAPIAIGSSVTLAHFVLVPMTGCGINPARSFGPHLLVNMSVDKTADNWWVFYTAPFAGALAATFLCIFVFGTSFDEDKEQGGSEEDFKPELETPTDNELSLEGKKEDHGRKTHKKIPSQCLDRKGSDSPH
jgi:glycerol uptake facilitator-like aquaporin